MTNAKVVRSIASEVRPFSTALGWRDGLMILTLLVVLGLSAAAARHYLRVRGLTPVGGTVLNVEVVAHNVTAHTAVGTGRREAYEPKVRYAYEVDGRHFEGSRLTVTARAYASEATAKRVLEAYPVGGSIIVWYQPDDPAFAVIDRRIPYLALSLLALSAAALSLLVLARLRTRRAVIALVTVGLARGLAAHAADFPVPGLPTAAPRPGEVVVEEVYRFAEHVFEPPVTIEAVTRGHASYATPEDAVIGQVSAMLTGDYEWWIGGWTKDSRAEIEASNARKGRTPADVKRDWATMIQGRTVKLLRRIDTDAFVFFHYVIEEGPGGLPPESEALREGTLAFRRVDRRWAGTREFAKDPVYLYWNTPDRKVRVIMR
jgi:hypothetical protein